MTGKEALRYQELVRCFAINMDLNTKAGMVVRRNEKFDLFAEQSSNSVPALNSDLHCNCHSKFYKQTIAKAKSNLKTFKSFLCSQNETRNLENIPNEELVNFSSVLHGSSVCS